MESTSITYTLFLYREQLHKKKTSSLRLSTTKLTLTDQLIKKNVPNIKKCSTDDVLAISRNIVLQSKLRQQIQRMSQTKRSGKKFA